MLLKCAGAGGFQIEPFEFNGLVLVLTPLVFCAPAAHYTLRACFAAGGGAEAALRKHALDGASASIAPLTRPWSPSVRG